MSPDKSLPIYTEVTDSQPVDGIPMIEGIATLNVSDPFEAAMWQLVCLHREIVSENNTVVAHLRDMDMTLSALRPLLDGGRV